ncbi:MAG: non-homologous end-joining DNA ligase [Ardenticatenaceae bacterium]|nr:non-homologous end-joining DNA ligase [Ardenticatenaceae bacterium]
MAKKGETWRLGGRDVRVTNLQKVFWPEQGYTKGDLLRYYHEVAPTLLPYMQDRPFTMRVWPDGITGKNFYRWRVPDYAPDWLERYVYHLQTADKTAEMAVVDDLPELIWVVNQGVIEMHPWFATRQDPDRPTWMVFDLDPVAEVSFEEVLNVAGWIHALLDELGLMAAPKTSGGDGVHVFVPIERRYRFEEVRAWLGAFIHRLEEAHPAAVTSDKSLAERGGKVLIDYSQNARGKSIAAPYGVRAKPGAPVSAPLTWDEVAAGRVRPTDFTLTTMPARLAERGDLFAEVLHPQQRLPDLSAGEE